MKISDAEPLGLEVGFRVIKIGPFCLELSDDAPHKLGWCCVLQMLELSQGCLSQRELLRGGVGRVGDLADRGADDSGSEFEITGPPEGYPLALGGGVWEIES